MGISGPSTVSPKLARIAQLASEDPERVLTSLAHHIDRDLLREAFARVRTNAAAGVDGQTTADFAGDLDANLEGLREGLMSGRYKAPPVKRAYVPKPGGGERPIGLPTVADKVLQRAVVMVLEPVFEQDFLDCSYGFRPGRSAHKAVQALWDGLMRMGGGWVVEADIQSFFDDLDHAQLRAFLDMRVRDGVLRRVIGKWLNAGVMDAGQVTRPKAGSPQGGVISPLLANIYLHHVLDVWFEQVVKPRLAGPAFLIRYADDFVIVCKRESDARRVLAVLPKRFARFGLTLHPDKTRIVPFERPRSGRNDGTPPGTFVLLGFLHHWGRSRRGAWVVKRRTSSASFRRSVRMIRDWCRKWRHLPIAEQHRVLSQKLHGHYGYFGITGNSDALKRFWDLVRAIWHKWLCRRSHKARHSWDTHQRKIAQRYPLPQPRVVHSVFPRAAKP